MTEQPGSQPTSPAPVGWEDAWQEGRTNWDAGCAAPSLVDLAQRGELPRVERTLVPGCGAGYDAMVLAQHSQHVLGLDIAPTGITRFHQVRQQAGLDEAAVQAVEADFFEFVPPAPFDRIWDYTFLCAIPIHRRSEWAGQMARLIRPGGELIALIFPHKWVRGDGDRGMPPFRLMPDEVEALVRDAFEHVSIEPVPPALSHQGREGLETLGRWRRRASG